MVHVVVARTLVALLGTRLISDESTDGGSGDPSDERADPGDEASERRAHQATGDSAVTPTLVS